MSTFAGVLGFPVRHSRSPAMMNAAFAELGLDWRYTALPVPPANFAETVRALHASGYRAANVTIPHKLAALEAADELSDTARSIGAVNTLTLSGDGQIVGDNTDAGGLLDALGEPVPGSALVLGAGGAARAAPPAPSTSAVAGAGSPSASRRPSASVFSPAMRPSSWSVSVFTAPIERAVSLSSSAASSAASL